MKLNKYIFHSGLLLSALTISIQTDAQVKPDTTAGKSITEEIEVVRPYKPVLADAAKIRRSPDMDNQKNFKPVLSYSVLDKKFELNSDIRQLQAQAPVQEKPAELKNNLVKIGAGSFNTGLGEIYLNTGRDEALQAGVFFKHLNQEGSLDGQKVSRQQAAVFGRSIQDKISLNGEIGFERLGTNFYGFAPEEPLTGDPAKQRWSTLALKGEILKNEEEDNDQEFSYAAKGDAYFLGSFNKQKENSFAVSGFLNKTWNQFNFGANTSLDLTTVKDSLGSSGNHIFRANPYVKFQGANYKLIIGANLVQEFGDASRTNLFPAVNVEFPVVPGYATIFGGYTGDVMNASLRQLSHENPYLAGSLTLNNAIEKMNLYGGVKGNAGAGFGFQASVFYKKIEDMPLFINDPENINQFQVIYDDSKIVGLQGEISVNVSETFTWAGKLSMLNYDMTEQKEAWFKPDFNLSTNARLSINNKLAIDAEAVLAGEREAKIYNSAMEESSVKLKSYVDMSAGAEYRFREKIGLYIRLNNIFGNEYQQYLYYPKLGLNILGGFNYSF